MTRRVLPAPEFGVRFSVGSDGSDGIGDWVSRTHSASESARHFSDDVGDLRSTSGKLFFAECVAMYVGGARGGTTTRRDSLPRDCLPSPSVPSDQGGGPADLLQTRDTLQILEKRDRIADETTRRALPSFGEARGTKSY